RFSSAPFGRVEFSKQMDRAHFSMSLCKFLSELRQALLRILSVFTLCLFLQVIKARQHAQIDIHDIINWRMAKHPFSEALQKDSAEGKKESNSNPPQRIRCPWPEETRGHLKPSDPYYREEDQTWKTQLSGRQRPEAVRRCCLRFVHIALRGNYCTGLDIRSFVV